MKNLYPRVIGLAILFFCLSLTKSTAQTITIDNSLLDAGPYGRGSTIAVPITVSGCFNIGNTFTVYLSNSTGSFATETAIGSYGAFFTTFVNATIPAGQAAGAGYKVRVKSNNPAIVSAASNVFTINAVTAGLVATADPALSSRILSSQIAFGWCSNVQQQTGFVMNNTATSGSVATATVKDEVNGFTQTALTYDASNQLSLNLERHYYTYINKAVKSGLVSTKAYFIINSPNKLGLSTDGEQQGCLPDTLTFQMGTDTASGIGNNFPGNRYQIDWGDGTALQVYTQCNLLSQGGLLKHYYVGVSCSKPNITFNVTTTLLNPWFNNAGTATQKNCDQPQVVSRAKIFKKPDAQFSFPNPACVNVPVTFANNTDPGQAQFGTQCINKADYRWYINGVLVQTNLQATPPPSMTHTFTVVGKYEIKLIVDNGSCEISTKVDSICIEPKPVTNFKINGVDSLVSCAPLNIATTNLTTGSPVCQALGYLWTVIDSVGNIIPAGTVYTVSPSNTSFEPSFIFLQEGKFKIRLTVTNVCGGIVKEKPVFILGTTAVVLPSDKAYCGLATINFATNTNHKPIYNISLGSETFGWTVSGGSYSFVGGTNATSAFPQIKFNDYATYTITSNFANICGNASDIQKISFSEPIATSITSSKYDTLCFSDNTANIAASTGGPSDSTKWFSTGTGSFANKYSTATVYTLSTADKSAGTIKLYYKTFAKQPSACADVSDTIYLNVIPHNYITSGTPLEICSNTRVGYVPTAFASGSVFNWTSAVQTGSLTGNTSSNGNINDSLINTSFNADATIKYTITPTKDGCVGDPFDLMVTVKPLPNLTAVAIKDTICADSENKINLGSSATGIKYTWTSSMSGGTIIGNSNQAAQTTSSIIKDTLYNSGATDVTVTYIIKVFGPTGCEGQTKTVNVVVRPKPNTANAGNDTIVCNKTSFQLNGNTPFAGNGFWSLVSGNPVTFADASNHNTTVNGLQPNVTYKFEWRITGNGNCSFTKDTVVIINRPAVTVANAGADKSICDFTSSSINTVNLSGNIDNTRAFESGIWNLASEPAGGNGGFSSLSNPNAVFTFNKVGTYVLVWKLSNDIGCTASTDTMKIYVYVKPVAGVTAPTSAITCNGTDVTINLQSYTGVINKWQYNTNPISDNIWVDTLVTNPIITIPNLQDTILVRCIVGSGGELNGCPSYDTTVYSYIAVNPKTFGGNTNPDATVCKNDNNGNIALTGNTGTVQRWEFSINNGTNWNQVNNTTPSQTYTNLNTSTIYRAMVQSGVCPPKYSDTTIITVADPVTTSNAGADQKLCNQTTATLNANTVTSGVGKWIQVAGTAITFVNDGLPNTAINNMQGNEVYKFVWKITGLGNCPPSTDTVVIINRPATTQANAGIDKVICDFTVSTNNIATLGANVDATRTYETGKWRIVQQPTSSSAYFNDDTKFDALFNFNKSGVYQLEWSISNDAGCPATKDTITIQVFDKPDVGIVAASPTTSCAGSTVTASVNAYTGIIKKWQYNPRPFNDNIWLDATGTNSSINFNNVQDSFAVRIIVQSNGIAMGCNSEVVSDSVIINITPKTVPGKLIGSTTVCEQGNSGNIQLTNYAGNIVKWQNSYDNGVNWIDIANTSSSMNYSNAPIALWYRTVVQSGVCPQLYSDTAIITVVKKVSPAFAGTDKLLCDQTSTLLNAALAGTGEIGLWNQVSGPSTATIVSPNSATSAINGMTGGIYSFLWLLTNNACPSTKDTIIIVNRPAITAASAGADKVICDFTLAGNNSISLSSNLDLARPFETGKWRIIQKPSGSLAYFDNDVSTTALFNFGKSGFYQLEWSIGNDAGCPATKDTIDINVFDKPSAGIVSANPIVSCYGSNITASISTYTGVIKKWQYNPKPFNDNIWIDIAGTNSSVNINNALDSFAVRVIIQSAGVAFGCTNEVASDSVIVNITPKTISGKLLGTAIVCETSNNGSVQLTNYAGNIIKWQNSFDNGTSWIDISTNNTSINYSNLSNTMWYRAVVQNGVCPQLYSDTAIITVVKAVTPANAGLDKLICNQASIQLNGNIAAVGETGLWQQLSGPTTATIVSPNNAGTTVNAINAGTYVFQWTLSNSTCPSKKDSIIVLNRPAITIANAGADKTICDFTLSTNNSTSLNANIDNTRSFETGKWRIIQKPNGSLAYFDNDANTNALFNFSKSGLYQLEWSISNDAGCPATKDTININVFDKPVAGVVVASPFVSCAGSTVTASIVSYTGIIKKWQYNTKPFNDNIWMDAVGANNTINFNNVQDSFAVRVIIQSDGAAMGCTSEAIGDSAIVNITPKTIPGKLNGSNNVCETGNFGNVNLTNYAGNIIKWQQSVDNGVSWIDIYTNSPIISYTNLGLTTWYRTVVQSGVCPQAFSDTAVIAVSKSVTKAIAGTNKLLCNQPSIQLNGNSTLANEIGLWKQLSGPSTSTIVSPNAPNTFVNSMVDGTYKFEWNISNAACPPTKDSMIVVIRPLITNANAGTDKVVCDFTATTNNAVTMAANLDAAKSYELGKWRIVQKPSTASASLDNDTKRDALFSFNQSGIYKLEWTISNDAGCPPTKDTVNVNVFDKPVVGVVAASPITACYGSGITASVTTFTGNIKKWQYNPKPYDDNIWIDAIGTASTVALNNMQDSFAVRVIVQSAGFAMGCTSEVVSDSVVINITPKTIPGKTTGNATVCELSNNGIINLGNYVGSIVKWQRSIDNGTNWIDVTSTNSSINYSNLVNTTWFRAVVQSGVCVQEFSDTAIVTVTKKVQTAFAGTDKLLCADASVLLNGNAMSSTETGLWQQISGPSTATIVSVNAATTTVNNLTTGVYQFEWKLSNNVCPATKDTVVVTNYPALQNSISNTDITICSGQSVTINGTVANGGNGTYVYQWQQSSDNVNWTNIGSATGINFSFLAIDTVYLRRVVESSPCNSISPIVKVMVQKPIANNTINSNQSICINTSAASIIGSVPTGADGNYQYQWQQSNDGGITWNDISSTNQKDYAPSVLIQTSRYRRLVSATLCNGQQSSTSPIVTITVNPDAKVQVAVAYQTGCAPFNINNTIISNTMFPSNNASYDWYVNNNFLGAGTDFPGYIINNPYDSVKIKLIAVSKFGCKNDSVSYMFYTRPVAQTAFTVSDTIGCGPLQVSFTNNTPNSNLFQYKWDFGNGQASSLVNPSSVTYLQAIANVDTVYRATLSAYTVCDTIRVEKLIRVQSKPMARFLPDRVTGCSPMTVSFINTSISTVATYVWDFGDGTIVTTNSKNGVQHTFYTGVPAVFNVKLKVTNQCGSDSMIYPITIQQNAILLNYSIAGDNKVCAPFTAKFINASIGSTGFRWDFGDGAIVNTNKNIDTVYHTYFTPGDYAIQLKATNGCSDTTAPRTLYVNRKPIAEFTALPSSVCVGDTVHFSNLTDTATSYVWRFGDGLTSNQTNEAHAYATAGVYTAKLQSTRTFSNGGSCVDSSSRTVTVVSKLPGSFLVSDTLGKCTPFIVTFTNQSLPSSLTTWDLGNNVADTGNIIVHSFNTVGTYNIKMAAQSPGGCKYEAEHVVKVVGPSGTFSYDHGFFCGNKPVRFQSNNQNVDSIKWNFGDGISLITTGNVVYHTYAQSGRYVPSIELLAGTTCRIPLMGLDTIKVDYIKAGYTVNLQKSCGYSKASFIDTSRSFFGVQQYAWTFGDGGTSNQASPQHQYNNTNNWAVQLVIKTNSGCFDTLYNPLYVHVPQKPQASIQSDTAGCVNEILNFNAVVNSIDTLNYYKWNFSNGFSSSNTLVSTSFPIAGTQTAQLIAGTTNGCYDTTYKQVRINPNPFVRTNQDMIICKGQTTPLNATGALSYMWSPTQSLSCSTCPNTLAAPQTTTQYVIAGFNQFGCVGYDTVLITVAQPFNIGVTPNDTLCIGQSMVLNAQGASKYTWSPAGGLSSITVSAPTASPTITTKYRVIGTDDYNCFRDTAYVTVAVGQYPVVNIGPDKVQQTGNLMPLKATFTNGPITSWRWGSSDFNCTTCAEPIVSIKKDACYYVEAKNMYGCAGRDTMCVKVFFNDGQVFIPNAFTPDGDGVNDMFLVRGKGIKLVKSFRIFNRWGQVVFEKNNFAANDALYGWDGKINGIAAPPDVFVYTCEIIADNDQQYITKGNVTILK
jgi:gliding motility-associated-like protein